VEPGGEIVVQNSGGYSTGFTISQSVTIDAAGFNASVISIDNSDLCTISAGANDRVVLRGISFHGANVGNDAINVTQVGSLYVERCSIAEFKVDGVFMFHGGKLFVTGTDVRACQAGIAVETDGATPAILVAHDSRFTECRDGVILGTFFSGSGSTGWMSDCTASSCIDAGFHVVSQNGGNVNLTLTNCRATGNTTGLAADNTSTGNATIRIANCLVTENSFGISLNKTGAGASAVVGTSPGTNLIADNGTDGSTSSSATLH
jgi:hypothetical protein